MDLHLSPVLTAAPPQNDRSAGARTSGSHDRRPCKVSLLSRAEAAEARRTAIDNTAPAPRLAMGWKAALLGTVLFCGAATQSRAQEVFVPAPDANAPVSEVTTVSAATVTTISDPLERMNRATFKFNNGADRYVMGPVSRGYTSLTPRVVRNRVGAVLANLGEPFTAVNDVLQVRARDAGRTTSRFLINSTIGGLGLFDVASRLGVEGHESDFGQTLGRYGAGSGPYLVLPLLGPTSLRDGVGQVVEIVADPVSMATAGVGSFGLIHGTTEAIHGRASVEPMVQALKQAPDPYASLRSAYAQNRAAHVSRARGEQEALPDFAETAR